MSRKSTNQRAGNKRICFRCNCYLTRPLKDGLEPLASCHTIDHVIPLSRGGEDTRDNRVNACYGCNQRKRATMPAKGALRQLGLKLPEPEVAP